MANFCFFTDADKSGLLNTQASSSAFGVVSDTEFRVTSLHTAVSNPRVFAICDGQVAVQQDGQSHTISLILKPTDQPGVEKRINFVSIKYIIYKGVLKDSLISGSSAADRSNNQLTHRAHVTQDEMNRATEVLLEEPVNSITLTPSSAFLGYNIVGTDNESLDKLFYKPDNSLFAPLSVAPGDYIGDFDKTLFGIEIVLDDIRANANFILTRHIETKLQAPIATANNASQLFKRRHQKEAAISFMDPCAFFGSFFQYGLRAVSLRYRLSTDIIDVEKETKDSDLHKASGKELYEDILVHFFNKNAVYIDIRNELNTSLNFYQHYANNIKLKIPQADNKTIDKDYYGNNGWPLLVLRPDDFDLNDKNNDSNKDELDIELALPNPSGENVSPLVYISQGYTRKIRRNKVLRGEKRYIPLATSDDYTESFSVLIPNISGESVITPVSQYIRIKYLKSVLKGASSGIVPRASNYLDLLFLPFKMNIPFAVTANSKSRIYNEDVYVDVGAKVDDAAKGTGSKFAGPVGIAEDTKNFTFIAYAGDKLVTSGTTHVQTISLPSDIATESHYLNLVRDRYNREKLFQGTLNIGSDPNPIYLRFADGNPTAAKNHKYPNLSDEFIAIVIDKDNFERMRLNNGFSNDYGIFIRLTNKDQDLTSDAIIYTTYDLVLEGYNDNGTDIFLTTYDPKIKVYSFGLDHNLILIDKDAKYDAATPFDELPSCASEFSPEELMYLKLFIEKTETASAPFKDLWDKVFNIPGGEKIEVEIGPPLKLKNPYPLEITDPPPPTLPRGFLAEACTIFTLFKFQQQLLVDTATTNNIDAPGKSTIYKALKEILINAGFKKPSPGSDTRKFNNMMVPDKHIGLRNFDFLDIMLDPAATLKREMYDLMKVGNLPGEHGDKNFVFLKSAINETDILKSIDAILKDYGNKIAFLVNRDSCCAYKIFLPGANDPENLFLASGNGSNTSGLFNDSDSGVLLFNYNYDGEGGVKKEATRPFKSKNPKLSTVVHLTLFGTNHVTAPDGGNSTVKVLKDGNTYIFKASGSNRVIHPVSGTTAGEARYDEPTKSFFSTISDGVRVAKYDPDKKDLMFIDIGRIFNFDVTLTSHTNIGALPDDDEISVSINVVEGPKLNTFEFEAEDLYEDDIFVLTDEKKNQLNSQLMADPKVVAAIDFMIDRLIKGRNISISINLRGNFVGKKLPPADRPTNSKVGPDTLYQFFFTRLEHRELEKKDKDEVNYPPLRYSFGKVVITDFDIFITIDSFVSPLWSRLDEKIITSLVPTPEEIAKKATLDNLTHYYAIPGSDAYVDHVGGDPHPTDPVNHPNLPSYNPILSCLRSFGLEEALNEIVVARARDIATESGYTESQITTMRDSLRDKLSEVKILKNELLGIGADIEFRHYTDFQP